MKVEGLTQRVNDGETEFAEAYREFGETRAREAWLALPVAERKRLEALWKARLDNVTA